MDKDPNEADKEARPADVPDRATIDYDPADIGIGRLLLWPLLVIAALGLLALAVNGLNFLGPY